MHRVPLFRHVARHRMPVAQRAAAAHREQNPTPTVRPHGSARQRVESPSPREARGPDVPDVRVRASHAGRPDAHPHRAPGDWNGGDSARLRTVVEAVGRTTQVHRASTRECFCDVAPLCDE
jgi:hypothetical protein